MGGLVLDDLGDGEDEEPDRGGFKASHCCLLAPVTTDAMVRADTAVEALDVPSWSAEATNE